MINVIEVFPHWRFWTLTLFIYMSPLKIPTVPQLEKTSDVIITGFSYHTDPSEWNCSWMLQSLPLLEHYHICSGAVSFHFVLKMCTWYTCTTESLYLSLMIWKYTHWL
jgi:hypothetical protein